MSVTLKPYPEYKKTGLPWLESVPLHWNVRRVKYIAREIDRRSATGREALLRVSQYTGVTRRAGEGDVAATRAESLIGYKIVVRSDLVINIMLAWNGSLGVSPLDGIVSPAYAVYRFNKEIEPSYYHFLFRTDVYKGRFKVASTGVVDSRLRIYSDDFFRVEALEPPLKEQRAITRFLSAKCCEIDSLIRAKRRAIELLIEQKQAIINRAVTRGLNPNVRLKPSGIEWLQCVPEHWTVDSLVRCITELSDYRGATPEKVESGVFLITAKNIRMGFIDYKVSEEFIRPELYEHVMRRGLPKVGDILLTMEAPLGNVAQVDREDIALAQRVIRFRMNPAEWDSKFALYSVMAPYFQTQLKLRGTGSTAQGLKASKLPQLLLVNPPRREQEQICRYLEDSLAKVEAGIYNAEHEIVPLREYRTRLIADVVTGKLDVRRLELPDRGEDVKLAEIDYAGLNLEDEGSQPDGAEVFEVKM